MIKAKMVNYRYDLTIKSDKLEYKKLSEQLKKQDYKLFAVIEFEKYKEVPENVTIKTDYLFNNQFNTEEGLRVFLWKESILVENRKIKRGHYMIYNPELMQAIQDQFACGYCGKRYFKPEQKFCNACFDDEFLSEKEFDLLQLLPVASDLKIKRQLSEQEKISIKNMQLNTVTQKQKERLDKQKIEIEKEYYRKIKHAEQEYKIEFALNDLRIDWKNYFYYAPHDSLKIGNVYLTETELIDLAKRVDHLPVSKIYYEYNNVKKYTKNLNEVEKWE